MKKLISLILAVFMLLSLAACTKKPAETDETADPTADITSEDGTEKAPESETETDTETETDKEDETSTDVEGDTVGEPDGDTSPTALTQDEALAIAKSFVGDRDPDLGYPYSVKFESVDAGTYRFKVSMFIEEQERYTSCGYVLVDPDGNATKFDW